jgi:hypothetical protein
MVHRDLMQPYGMRERTNTHQVPQFPPIVVVWSFGSALRHRQALPGCAGGQHLTHRQTFPSCQRSVPPQTVQGGTVPRQACPAGPAGPAGVLRPKARATRRISSCLKSHARSIDTPVVAFPLLRRTVTLSESLRVHRAG